MHAAADVLSPELVLVSPPAAAAEARRLLGDTELLGSDPGRGQTPAFGAAVTVSPRAIAVFYAVSLLGTLGPLALAYSAR